MDYKKSLYMRMVKEYDEYIGKLLTMPPEQIVQQAFKKVSMDELLCAFLSEEITQAQAEALCKKETLLEDLYANWLFNDLVDNTCYIQTIQDVANRLTN